MQESSMAELSCTCDLASGAFYAFELGEPRNVRALGRSRPLELWRSARIQLVMGAAIVDAAGPPLFPSMRSEDVSVGSIEPTPPDSPSRADSLFGALLHAFAGAGRNGPIEDVRPIAKGIFDKIKSGILATENDLIILTKMFQRHDLYGPALTAFFEEPGMTVQELVTRACGPNDDASH
jgi:hypothetical protein